MSKAIIGVLALQGDFREHLDALGKCGAGGKEVRLPADLDGIAGLIIPGGESTTIGKLMAMYGMDRAIRAHHDDGMAIWGTCAGAILLARGIIGSSQPRLGMMDIAVKRNEYGRQVDSFETKLDVKGIGNLKGVFIRAPVIHHTGKAVEVLASHRGHPVLVRQDRLLASTFHPELSGSMAVHRYFIAMARNVG